jgi:hypothetical protein
METKTRHLQRIFLLFSERLSQVAHVTFIMTSDLIMIVFGWNVSKRSKENNKLNEQIKFLMLSHQHPKPKPPTFRIPFALLSLSLSPRQFVLISVNKTLQFINDKSQKSPQRPRLHRLLSAALYSTRDGADDSLNNNSARLQLLKLHGN